MDYAGLEYKLDISGSDRQLIKRQAVLYKVCVNYIKFASFLFIAQSRELNIILSMPGQMSRNNMKGQK